MVHIVISVTQINARLICKLERPAAFFLSDTYDIMARRSRPRSIMDNAVPS